MKMPESRYEVKKAGLKFGMECLQENCANCKHGLCLSRRIYCTVLQDKIDDTVIAEHCHFFEPEPLEFKLFRRA
jgi:hypothetical protein